MKQYVTIGGEMVDEVCHAHYGNNDQLNNVLNNNVGLEFQPFILPAGIVINLPDVEIEKQKGVSLW